MGRKPLLSILGVAAAAGLAGILAGGAVSQPKIEPTANVMRTAPAAASGPFDPGAASATPPKRAVSRASAAKLRATRAQVASQFGVFNRAARASDRLGPRDTQARDSRRIVLSNDRQVVLYYSADGLLCVVGSAGNRANGEACAPAATAASDPPVLELSRTDGSETYLFGAVPDGVSQVEARSPGGDAAATVQDNAFAIRVAGRVTDSDWVMRDGSRRDRP